jgi:hypothetical protein
MIQIKQKLLLYIYSCMLLTLQTSAQNSWHSVGTGSGPNAPVEMVAGDPVNDRIYIGGQFWQVDGIPMTIAAFWDESQQQYYPMGCASGTDFYLLSGEATGCTLNGDLFMGGANSTTVGDYCSTIPVAFTKMQYDHNLNRWDAMGGNMFGDIYSTTTYQNKIVIAGQFVGVNMNTTVDVANNVAVYNGTAWEVLGTGTNTGVSSASPWCMVQDVIEYNGELFVSGMFELAGGAPLNNPGVARWTGQTWTDAGSSYTASGFFAVCNNELYLASSYGDRIYKWTGSDWVIFAQTPIGSSSSFKAMIEYNGNLVVTGHFSSIDGVYANNIAMHDGTQWMPMGSGITCSSSCGYAYGQSLTTLNGSLYLGGSFDYADGVSAKNIARWGPVNTTTIDEKKFADGIKLVPNPASDYISIESKFNVVSVTVQNLIGEQLLSQNASLRLETTSLPTGIYFLRIEGENGICTAKKFVVQHQ